MTDYDLNLDGFEIESAVLNTEGVNFLRHAIANVQTTEAVRTKRDVYAIRNLLHLAPDIAAFARSSKIQKLAESALGSGAMAVRATLFDKTPDANWLVPWHQDLTICVQERIETPGFGPWTLKAGVHHVQPPMAYLEQMVAIRVHLDDCDEHNGALRVLPGSHRLGRLSPDQIEQIKSQTEVFTCAAKCGVAVLMKPLLLHASAPALRPAHRRVVHIEFASAELPHGLRWLGAP